MFTSFVSRGTHDSRAFSRYLALLACVFTIFFGTALPGRAQVRRDGLSENIEIKVRVVSATNEQPINFPVRVTLLSGTGIPVNERFSNDQGFADFQVRPGSYRLRVASTDRTEEYTSDSFIVNPRELARFEYVRLMPKPGQETATGGQVNIDELNIPGKARKEFEKGNKALQEKRLEDARSSFQKATEIYPRYAAAFNNLGVVAMMSGDVASGRINFEKALSINDRNANANLNMARIHMGTLDFKEAAAYLEKTLLSEPTNGQALLYLANAQQQMGNFAAVLPLAQKLHGIDHAGFPEIHILAGNALRKLSKMPEAAEEYRTFLKEAPSAPMSNNVRDLLKQIETDVQHTSAKR